MLCCVPIEKIVTDTNTQTHTLISPSSFSTYTHRSQHYQQKKKKELFCFPRSLLLRLHHCSICFYHTAESAHQAGSSLAFSLPIVRTRNVRSCLSLCYTPTHKSIKKRKREGGIYCCHSFSFLLGLYYSNPTPSITSISSHRHAKTTNQPNKQVVHQPQSATAATGFWLLLFVCDRDHPYLCSDRFSFHLSFGLVSSVVREVIRSVGYNCNNGNKSKVGTVRILTPIYPPHLTTTLSKTIIIVH